MTNFGIAPNAKEVAARVFLETVDGIDAARGGILTLNRESTRITAGEENEAEDKTTEPNEAVLLLPHIVS